MRANLNYFIFFIFISSFYDVLAEEMIFGEETIAPGFTIVFEATPKDTIFPERTYHLIRLLNVWKIYFKKVYRC